MEFITFKNKRYPVPRCSDCVKELLWEYVTLLDKYSTLLDQYSDKGSDSQKSVSLLANHPFSTKLKSASLINLESFSDPEEISSDSSSQKSVSILANYPLSSKRRSTSLDFESFSDHEEDISQESVSLIANCPVFTKYRRNENDR
ncbi:uncharacterized protein LOC135847631 [Planococcus citri]|uniref:uncharacterized protein LOC135847631 n=1 Tax=Planococcus citri TaxID=170843 RepID=UPI0031FA2A7A